MTSVVALLTDRESRARLDEVLRHRASVTYCATGTELVATVASGRPAVVVVALRDGTGASTAPAIRALRQGFPSVAVLAYCGSLTPAAAHDILAAARAGAGDLVVRGDDDTGVALRDALQAAERQGFARRATRELRPLVPAVLLPLFHHCLANATRAMTVEELAVALGVHRKTLVSRLLQAGLPPPSVVIGWSRLALAAYLMEDPARSVEGIANELDFASGSALRNMLKRYTGLRPGDVRQRGGSAWLLTAFGQALCAPLTREPGRAERAASTAPSVSAGAMHGGVAHTAAPGPWHGGQVPLSPPYH